MNTQLKRAKNADATGKLVRTGFRMLLKVSGGSLMISLTRQTNGLMKGVYESCYFVEGRNVTILEMWTEQQYIRDLPFN